MKTTWPFLTNQKQQQYYGAAILTGSISLILSRGFSSYQPPPFLHCYLAYTHLLSSQILYSSEVLSSSSEQVLRAGSLLLSRSSVGVGL